MKDYHQRVREKRHLRLDNGWTFELHRLDEHAFIYIPVTGWGGYGGAAIPEQETWVRETLEPIEGVKGTWMGVWQVELTALDAVLARLGSGEV